MKTKNTHNKKRQKKAFTLVELIIVITILAILATIAFVSFQGYMKGARDSNRVATVKNIQKGLDAYVVQAGSYPVPDDKSGTGTVNGNPVTNIGYIGDNIARIIRISSTPTDPGNKGKYVYGVDATQTKYQIATVSEDVQAFTYPMMGNAYADGGVTARVIGNYNGLLKYNGKIYNIPSLVITFSGSNTQDLLATNTNFVIDKAENLPYTAGQAKVVNTLSPTQVLQKLTNTGGALVVTGITLPTDATTWNTSSGTLQSTLGYKIDVVGQEIFGATKYITEIKTTASTAPSGGFTCGSAVSAGGYTYTTKSVTGNGGYSKCWTSQNMSHLPPVGASACYSNLSANCDSHGRLYDWAAAMSICQQLGTGWTLPSNTDWTDIIAAGATGRLGNKLFGLISKIPGYNSNGGYYSIDAYTDWRSSTEYGLNDAYARRIHSANSDVVLGNFHYFGDKQNYKFPVICVKN